MALKFNESKGAAIKNSLKTFQYKDGDNSMRIVGDILARYVYWVEGENGKKVPMECLSFNRDEERFTNEEKDWVEEYFPDLNCSWSYVTQCVMPDGEIQIVNLKKKMWEEVVTAAEDLGDPTDIETGWDLKFVRKKTGKNIYNVAYTLQVMKCAKSVRPLTEKELEGIENLKSMDVVMPRPTPEQQKEFLDKITKKDEPEETDVESIEDEFKVDG